MTSSIERYISDGEVQRSRIALDVADGSLSPVEIRDLCSDQKIKSAFVGASYSKKRPKETWDSAYLDQVVCSAAAESFNQDYLLYLAEVGEYVRGKKPRNNPKLIAGIAAAAVIVAASVGAVMWKTGNTGSSREFIGQQNDDTEHDAVYDGQQNDGTEHDAAYDETGNTGSSEELNGQQNDDTEHDAAYDEK